jgi:hypothetical protein
MIEDFLPEATSRLSRQWPCKTDIREFAARASVWSAALALLAAPPLAVANEALLAAAMRIDVVTFERC